MVQHKHNWETKRLIWLALLLYHLITVVCKQTFSISEICLQIIRKETLTSRYLSATPQRKWQSSQDRPCFQLVHAFRVPGCLALFSVLYMHLTATCWGRFFFFFKPPFRDEEIEAQRFKTLRVLRKKCQDHNLNPYCLAPVSDSSVLSYCIFWCFWDCSAFNLMILNLSLHPSSPLTSVISIPAASWVALPESLAGTCNSTWSVLIHYLSKQMYLVFPLSQVTYQALEMKLGKQTKDSCLLWANFLWVVGWNK